jgi:hypothetical protein
VGLCICLSKWHLQCFFWGFFHLEHGAALLPSGQRSRFHFGIPLEDEVNMYSLNKSPTKCNNFPVYYPEVYLQLNMFRAFSRPSSGAQ